MTGTHRAALPRARTDTTTTMCGAHLGRPYSWTRRPLRFWTWRTNASPSTPARWADSQAGFNAVHVFDRRLGAASGNAILEVAFAGDRTIISSDTDFGALLALHDRRKPSFVLLRRINDLTPDQHAQLLIANVLDVADELEAGAVVTIDRTRIRVRRLPILRGA